MSKIIVHKRAAKYLQKLPKNQKENLKQSIKELADKPLSNPKVKQMIGEWAGYHRMRIGNCRVIFWYDESNDAVYIDHIGPRVDVYK